MSKKEYFPKIAIVAVDADAEKAAAEFYKVIGEKAFGLRICSLEEAIEQRLPIKAAQYNYARNIPHDVLICKGVDELVPVDYEDPAIPVHLDSVVFKSDDNKIEFDIGIQPQQRNDICLCGSGKKFKKCCIKKLV